MPDYPFERPEARWVSAAPEPDCDADALLELPLDFESFFEKALDNACVAGFDGYFKRLNPAWSASLGWTAEELLSRPSIDFVHPDDRAETLAGRERLTAGGELGPLLNRYLCKGGGFRWFEWRSVADVQRRLVYCVARDVTAQKQAEERLAAAKHLQGELERQLFFADRMASVGTLAAGVAHEINTPLSFITANVSLLLERLLSSNAGTNASEREELANMAKEALLGAERIAKTVGALRTFSRSESEARQVVDVLPLLELSIKMTANEIRHRARLVRDFGPIPLVEVDDARLGQVFINLLINAAQAIPEDGQGDHEIRVVTRTDERGHAVIEIRDTGPGVPPALAGRIFEPFFTTKPVGVGTGLGLSVSHAIVTSMGGTIAVADSSQPGATFRVVLPAASAPQPSAAPSDAVPSRQSQLTGAVLVVDDEPLAGIMLERVLDEHRVTAVTSGSEALQLLGSGARFDVIISDVMMPDMSGVDLHQELTRHFPEVATRLVFLTGGAFTPATRAFLEQTGVPRIDKPFDPQRVRDVVQRVIHARAAEPTRSSNA